MGFWDKLLDIAKIGSIFIPGVGPMVSGGLNLLDTALQGKKGKWGIDELLSAVTLGAGSGVPGLENIPFIGSASGSGGNNVSNAVAYGAEGALGNAGGGGGMGGILGKILGGVGGAIKGHPIETALLLTNFLGQRQRGEISDIEKQLLLSKLRQQQELEKYREPAKQALFKMLSANPYSFSTPNLTSIFKPYMTQ